MNKFIKISLFLIMAMTLHLTKVDAKEYDDSFYPGRFISNEYIRKEKNGKIENKQSRFIFRTSDKMFAYCIEPFKVMKENEVYESYFDNDFSKVNLSEDTWKKIRLISYYGYGYGSHTEDKWYTITQIMIWKVIDPEAKFNWTDELGGKVISKYENEMNEINQLVLNHNKLPNYANKQFKTSINNDLILEDKTFDIDKFKIISSSNITINKITNTKININSKVADNYELEFINEDNRFQNVPIIYIDDNAQNIMVIGNNATISFKLYINIESGSLKIKKLDKDTKSISSNNGASIIGTTYHLYNDKKEYIDELVIDSKGEITYNNLPYGNYCVKEVKSGKGYLIDDEYHCFTINEKNLNIELTLYNEVIKEEIVIKKYLDYSQGDLLKEEPNIIFNITGLTHSYNNRVVTDENGQIKLVLPYGKYLFQQKNTTNGYAKVEDFVVEINGNEKQHTYKLIDKNNSYEINVPNTGVNQLNIKKNIFLFSFVAYIGILIIDQRKKS